MYKFRKSQRRILVSLFAMTFLGAPVVLSQSAGASAPGGETITFTVPLSLYNQVKADAKAYDISSDNGLWHWILCKSPPEPVPKKIKTVSGTVFYRVTLSAKQVQASNKAIRKSCGGGSIRHDYQISLKVMLQTLTTTTTSPSGSQTTPAHGSVTLLTQSGSGSANTAKFTVTKSSWQLQWSFDCSSSGGQGEFLAKVNGYGAAANTADSAPFATGSANSGDEHYQDQGTFNLSISSTCSWKVTVVQP